jgi:hypothetical protein
VRLSLSTAVITNIPLQSYFLEALARLYYIGGPSRRVDRYEHPLGGPHGAYLVVEAARTNGVWDDYLQLASERLGDNTMLGLAEPMMATKIEDFYKQKKKWGLPWA